MASGGTMGARIAPAAGALAICASLALGAGGAAGEDAARLSVYEKDVVFLLDSLEAKAGGFFKLKGIDWKAVRKQFRTEAKLVRSDPEHVKLCARLLARLRDGHARLEDLKAQPPDESKGRRWTGPRVHLVTIGEKVHVKVAFGSAEKAGISAGMEVARIDGQPARAWLSQAVERLSDESGYSTRAMALYFACHAGLADWEGKPIEFELVQGGKAKRVRLVRSGGPNFVPNGPVFPPAGLRPIGRQSYGKTEGGFAYIHLRDVPGDLPEQLDRMLEEIGDAPGLILDCRANGGGGCDHAAVFGRFVPAGTSWRQYPSAGAKPFGGPLVVIVDAGVRSAGETIAGQFKEDGRGYLIGDSATAGTSSQKGKLSVPSGLFAVRFSVASNKERFNGGKGIEGIGVAPHETTPYDPEDLRAGKDTQIRRAEEILRKGIPKGKVPYAPPGR